MKILLTIISLSLAYLSSNAVADEQIKFSSEPIEQCLETSEGVARLKCVGKASDLCMRENHGGGTTIGMSYCLNTEGEWWDKKLNEVYKKLLKKELADDNEIVDYSIIVPRKVPVLKDMQRAWIKYRDTLCEHEAVQFGGGTGAGPAYAACNSAETARQYFVLEDRLNSGF